MSTFTYDQVKMAIDEAFDAAMKAEKEALQKIKPSKDGYIELGSAVIILPIEDGSLVMSYLMALNSIGVTIYRRPDSKIAIHFLLINGGQLLTVSEAASGAALRVLKDRLSVDGYIARGCL